MDESFVETALGAYGDTVLRLAASVTGNKADAEDVFSDVFFALYMQSNIFYSENHLKAWLIKVTVNKSKNVRASAWNRKSGGLNENTAGADAYDDGGVLSALQKLKNPGRAVVYLHYYEGYAYNEIARMLGMREGSVRSIAGRARMTLRELLSD